MKRFIIRLIISLMTATIIFAGFSCTHRNAGIQGEQVADDTPPEHDKMLTEYSKGWEELKKLIVARVNGAGITLSDLQNEMNRIAQYYIPPDHQRTPEIDQKVKQESLAILIFRELAVQEAVRQGMTVSSEMVEQFIQKLKADMGSEDAYRNFLQKTDITEESLKKMFERNQLFDMIAAKNIYLKSADRDDNLTAEEKKQEWEAELKKNAAIEILLEEVENRMKAEAEKRR